MKNTVPLILIVTVIFFIGCNSSDNEPGSSEEISVAENLQEVIRLTEENYEKWQYMGLENYMFTLHHAGSIGCPLPDGMVHDAQLPSLRITVEQNTVVSIYYADGPDVEAPPLGGDYVGTIDHIFQWLFEQFAEEPEVLSYTYDSNYKKELPQFDESFGFINRLYIRHRTSEFCEAWSISVSDFN